MKTLQLVPAMEQGGVERGVVEVNRALVAAGWENVVVSSGGRLVEQIAADGGRHIEMDVKSKNPLTCVSRALRLRRILSSERPDVVCAHSRVPAWLFVMASRGLGLKWMTFAHGANSVSWYSRVMTFGDLVVTPSRFIADYLKENYGLPNERIRVIPRAIDRRKFDVEGLDCDFIATKRKEWGVDGKFVVMGVGRITQLKGYDMLIRAVVKANAIAMSEASSDPHGIKPFKLVIVGEAEQARKGVEDGLHALVESLAANGDVVFAGNQRKIAECVSMANVVVSSNTRKPEAFGRSMAESIAMGTPVVAKGFGGALDIVEDGVNGVLVPSGVDCGDESDAFAEAIVKVSRMRFGDLRSAALKKFSFDLMIERTMAAYSELAGPDGSRST